MNETVLTGPPRPASQEASTVEIQLTEFVGAVCRGAELPDHDDFRDTPEHARGGTVLPASASAVQAPGFAEIAESREEVDPGSKNAHSVAAPSLAHRLRRFARQQRKTKYFALAGRARSIFPEMPIPLRLPFGAWWLAQKSALDHQLMHGSFEDGETRFVQKFLRPGMTVLDVGAHHGLYTLLASKKVGRRGKVIAFEPSSRERRRLLRHVRVNACRNVVVEGCALGNEVGEADLFVVRGWQDWCNSLRPPAVEEGTETIRVSVETLDDVLWRLRVDVVDFIKLDAEGAELGVLQGARELLRGAARPVILAEVQDLRTQPWGYRARDIVELLLREKYCWFAVTGDGNLQPAATDMDSYDANLVAVPAERVDQVQKSIAARR